LATLQVAALLRARGHRVSLYDAMLADGGAEYERCLTAAAPQVVVLYEDNYNFLSKMCLAAVRAAACTMVARARARGARVIVAGSDVTDAPEPYLRAGADVALLGEGLPALTSLIARLDSAPSAAVGELVADLGGVARLPVPLQLVREADLGQSVRPARPGSRRRRAALPQAHLRSGPHLVCR